MRILVSFSLMFLVHSGFYNNQAFAFPNTDLPEIKKAVLLSQAQNEAIAQILKSMVVIHEGKFQMGSTEDQGNNCSSDESPIHQVSISSFYISKIEVTQGWWKAIMKDNPSSYCRSDDFPVEMVSHLEALDFIDTLNKLSGLSFRLPTEAEWEYSARGGEKSCSHKYSGSSDANEVAWTSNNSYGKTHVVKLKYSNELGLFDMSGNVWEWVSDWYGKYTAAPQNDPRGASFGSEKVIRGGSWAGSPDFCRNAIRHRYSPDFKSSYIGFRLAIDHIELVK
jgi:formylglycine-generating enzyme required for sulfatase activity